MTANVWPDAIRHVLLTEGGYVNNPRDPGGPTNMGVTIADVRRYIKKGATAADVRALTKEQATEVYHARYWNALSCDALPAGLDYATFDYGVNSGVGRPPKVLRRICGLPNNAPFADLLTAINKRSVTAVINAMMDERLRFLKALPTWDAFGKGWTHRIAEVRAIALQIASKVVARDPVVSEDPVAKGAFPAPTTLNKIVVGGATAVPAAAGISGWEWVLAHPVQSFAVVAIVAVAIGAMLAALKSAHTAIQTEPMPLVPVPAKVST